MIFNLVDPNKANNMRVLFLQLVQDEIEIYKEVNKSKVNSQTVKQSCLRFVDDVYYEMKEKKLFEDGEFLFKLSEKKPRRISDRIAKMKVALSRKNSICGMPGQAPPVRLDKKGVSDQKFAFFRRNTLSKFQIPMVNLISNDIPVNVEDVIEYINTECGFFNNAKTLQRTEKGFTFLNTLVDRLKLKKEEHTFDELKKILCLKENIDEDSFQDDGRLSNRSKRSGKLTI
jgi:hypothetical protein